MLKSERIWEDMQKIARLLGKKFEFVNIEWVAFLVGGSQVEMFTAIYVCV